MLRLVTKSLSTMATAASKKFDYDLVVIGGGSGGVRAARISAGYGARVALIESSMKHGPPTFSAIGGTCVNVGCVPKKLLVYASKFQSEFKLSASYGYKQSQEQAAVVDWATLVNNKNTEITRLNGAYSRILSSAPKLEGSMRVIEGHGSLVNANTVRVSSPDGKTSEELHTARVLICVGGWPQIPQDLVGREHVVTSNEMFYLDKLPKRAVVVGGGYIAVEFAGILRGLGVDVIQCYRGDLFLRGFDQTCREHLLQEMQKKGVTLKMKTNPVKIERLASNGPLRVTNDDGTVFDNIDLVLYATGRVPKLDGLGLDKVGVKIGRKGEILVNERNETNVPGVYAVGDCTDRLNLTPVALREGHLLADSLFGNKHRTVDYKLVPCAVFSQPELSYVGLSEEEAVKEFGNVSVYTSTFKPMKYTMQADSTERSLFKLIVDDNTDRVVGVHAITENAGEIVQGFAVALRCGATKQQFDDTIGIHPTSAEEFVTMRTPSYKFVNGVKASSL